MQSVVMKLPNLFFFSQEFYHTMTSIDSVVSLASMMDNVGNSEGFINNVGAIF